MKTLGNRGNWENVEHKEFCSEMVGEGHGVGQSMQGGWAEICRIQKGANRFRLLDQGILVRTRAYSRDKAIGVTKDFFRYRAEEQLA